MKIYLNNSKYLKFDRGNFDKWCVFEVDEDGNQKAPLDIDYFIDLKRLSSIFTPTQIYEDFIKVYNNTSLNYEESTLLIIKNISSKYKEYSEEIYRILCTLYLVMISEENKKNTRLGKRIKRLGVYYLLIKNQEAEYCANFMRGMNWKEIDELCKEGGF